MSAIDQPEAVRAGDELDRRALETWLLGHLRDARGPLQVRQFHHGHSNLNYLLDLGGRELVLRRAAATRIERTLVDIGREYRLLASLHPVWGCVPAPLAFCPDPSVIGAPFQVTARVRGTILRRSLAPAPELQPAHLATLADEFVRQLAALHRIDPQLAGLGGFGAPRDYVARHLEAWAQRYQSARTADSPDIAPLLQWLRRRIPPEQPAALIHNEWRYDNLVLDPQQPTRILAVLDWELATLADARVDLGTALALWIEAGDARDLHGFGITHLPGQPDREALLAAYERHAQRRIEDPVFFHAFGLLRLLGVLQPIYARFRRGERSDPRLAKVIGLVHDVAELAQRTIRADRISAR
jgi:aminoglycoside phosphotransferase (APT) family kinase protein